MSVKKDVNSIVEIQITLKSLVKQINNRFDRQEKNVISFQKELTRFGKEMNKRFDYQDNHFFRWKSDIMNKIDKFAGRVKKQDQEIGSIGFRKEDHENRLTKLEQQVYNQTTI